MLMNDSNPKEEQKRRQSRKSITEKFEKPD